MITFESTQNQTVLLRCDFNEPINKSADVMFDLLESTKRIDANIATIHELLARKNKVILISHHSDMGQTMLPVYNYLKNIFKEDLDYVQSVDQKTVKNYFDINKNAIKNQNKKIFLLENTRLFGDSLDEKNDTGFAKFLASLADVFVYDAFSVGHREHASTTGVAKIMPSCFGPIFLREYNSLNKVTKNLSESLIFMGGAKLSTKLPMVSRFLESGAIVCLGGAMIHLILKSQENKSRLYIKDSYLEKDFGLDKNTLENLLKNIENKNLILPTKLVWQEEIIKNEKYAKIVDNIFDFKNLEQVILKKNIKNILWNGPVGMYESGHGEGSECISVFIKNQNNVFSVVGGGDTIAFLEEEQKKKEEYFITKSVQGTGDNLEKSFSYISLSGGAMLQFLSTGTLPILSHILIKNVI